MPRPCRALTGNGSPSPRPSSSQMIDSWEASSTLLATTRTDSSRPRNRAATRSSSSVNPTVASTTNSTTSASAMACSL